MKVAILICGLLAVWLACQAADKISPPVTPLSEEEIGALFQRFLAEEEVELSLVRRGLISDQMTLRADSARYIAHHGTRDDVPYLIDALADESMHVGARYIYAGMATTRYWANVALISICKVDLGYRWDDPVDSRTKAIDRWKQWWELEKK